MDEIMQDEIDALYVESTNGAERARAAFEELEKHLPGTQRRKFYGTYDPATKAYRACVALKPEDGAMGLPHGVIPGGKYLRRKLDNWAERIPEIGHTFIAMAD